MQDTAAAYHLLSNLDDLAPVAGTWTEVLSSPGALIRQLAFRSDATSATMRALPRFGSSATSFARSNLAATATASPWLPTLEPVQCSKSLSVSRPASPDTERSQSPSTGWKTMRC